MAYITGVGDTAFGRLEGSAPLTLMAAHGAPGVVIGEPVRVHFFEHGGRHLPRFERA